MTSPHSSDLSSRTLSRRDALLGFAGVLGLAACRRTEPAPEGPAYLGAHTKLWGENPRQANVEWFRAARLGLFIHYGLYSLDGSHAFLQHRQKIPVLDYEKRKDQFTAEKFNPENICELAQDAGMKYVNLVTKHCEGFCLWNTRQTDFNSVNSPAKRDFVEEFANACAKRNMGLFLFYEHGFDWRHPHGPRHSDFPVGLCEVPYEEPEPTYAHGAGYDLQNYNDYVSAHIDELLSNYGPIAGIWLDGAAVPASGDWKKFKLLELYNQIHQAQPQTIVSYKWGITGTEDFLAPEKQQIKRMKDRRGRVVEICVPLNPGWGWVKDEPHEDADWVMREWADARELDANLLVNIGPVADGSIFPQDIETLREAGRRIRS